MDKDIHVDMKEIKSFLLDEKVSLSDAAKEIGIDEDILISYKEDKIDIEEMDTELAIAILKYDSRNIIIKDIKELKKIDPWKFRKAIYVKNLSDGEDADFRTISQAHKIIKILEECVEKKIYVGKVQSRDFNPATWYIIYDRE